MQEAAQTHPNDTAEITATIEDDVYNTYSERLMFGLRQFPRLAHSMMPIVIGVGTPTKVWEPVLRRLVAEGLVRECTVSAKAPSGRHRQTKIYMLTDESQVLPLDASA